MKSHMIIIRTLAIIIVIALCSVTLYEQQAQAADREKLLSDPGVYATFAAFKLDPEWWKLDKGARDTAAAAVKEVVHKHGEHMAIET
jgi:chlorite dismutase